MKYRYRWVDIDNEFSYGCRRCRLELSSWGEETYKKRKTKELPFIGENQLYTPGYLRRIALTIYKRPKSIFRVLPDPEYLEEIPEPPSGFPFAIGMLIPSQFFDRKPHIYRGKVDGVMTFHNTDGFDCPRTIDAFFLDGKFKEAQDYDNPLITRDLNSFRFHLTARFGIYSLEIKFGDFLGTFLEDSNLPEEFTEKFSSILESPK